ncbi:MAG: hypothetical protein E6I48_03250 [Chloroflexi bacterium]|nr:MAG: hypothetical protein E6I48_03250 [Chloroflexota bacterium]
MALQGKVSACHLDKLRTGASPVAALSNRRVRLFSDLLLHDMGGSAGSLPRAIGLRAGRAPCLPERALA